MDIKLGKLRVNLSALALYDRMADPVVSRFVTVRQAPRKFYHWECLTQSGTPEPRPDKRRREPALLIHFAGLFGGVDQDMNRTVQASLLRTADLKNMQALDAELLRALPPLEVPIDWSQLLDPFKGQYALDFYEQVTYLQLLARPYGMMPEDHFYVFVPHLVTFSARVTGRCTGTERNGTFITGYSPHIVLKGARGRLERQVAEEEAEAEERRQHQAEENPFGMPFHGWDLNPTHEEEDD